LALLALVLVIGAAFRFSGIDWGENTFMHPDERFLLMVGSALEPVGSFADYFDTANSTLNPHNRGHGFYVYGTLPMFLTRYAVEWQFGQSGLIEMLEVGRRLSAFFDLLTVLLVAAIAFRLYGRAASLLASGLAAFTVLHIQQSHFFTMDTFITFFTVLAIYFSVCIVTDSVHWKKARTEFASGPREEKAAISPRDGKVGVFSAPSVEEVQPEEVDRIELGEVTHAFSPAAMRGVRFSEHVRSFVLHPLFFLSIGFGAALGMAVASKLNAAPVAMMLPMAVGIYFLSLPSRERERRFLELFAYLVLAAVVSIVAFRIFQPYAFSGPGFFGLFPNQKWVANIQEQRIQAAGDVDFPPAMQWARRPIWFSFQNMVLWGMGLPYGLLAWAGFLWMGWLILKGERRHLLLWGWTAFYFTWQSMQFNPTMRYQLPIYPTLAVIAGWSLVRLWHSRRSFLNGRILASVLGLIVLSLTLAWAYAFSGIYDRPFTRVEASRWIYQNIPGPINLQIESQQGLFNQIISYPYGHAVTPTNPYYAGFEAKVSGVLQEIYLPQIKDQSSALDSRRISALISNLPMGEDTLAQGEVEISAAGMYTFFLDHPAYLEEASPYYLTLFLTEGNIPVEVCEPVVLHLQTPTEVLDHQLPVSELCILSLYQPYSTSFSVPEAGIVNMISFSQVEEAAAEPGEKSLKVTLSHPGTGQILSTTSISGIFNTETDGSFIINPPVFITEGERYDLRLDLDAGDGALTLLGAPVANEGDWDDGLPLRIEGYDAFGGIYPPGLNFHMYHDDSPEKLDRFLRILDESDYLLISSNRQWASLPRIPERFPLVTTYYRHLLGCPEDQNIQWCYNIAKPGTFQGNLGYELIQVFQSDPTLGPISVNTQFAEEAFTVYDHPKVFIFKKTDSYDPARVSEILGSVDFSKIIRLTPKKAPSHPADLMLPTARVSQQRQGGTWSEMFDVSAPQNRNQFLGVLLWYLALALLGMAVYPLVRLGLPGLPDRGYPLARTAGLVFLAYLAWIIGSAGIPVTRLTIALVFVFLLLLGVLLTLLQRREIRNELVHHYKYFLIIEGLFLAFFIVGLLLRLGNPDLWHQYFGGEKPMDFAYFNAVLKSTTFPPYDPWFAGGYLNYYYYGFVLVGIWTKLLGIVPAIAYNLILPTIFTLIAMGAFSATWNIYQRSFTKGRVLRLEPDLQPVPPITAAPGILVVESPETHRTAVSAVRVSPYFVGLMGAVLMAVLGNLGTLRMLFQGYQRIVAPGGVIEGVDIFTRLYWAAQGFFRTLSGAQLPYRISDWYWLPSRVIPAQGDIEPITEFPFFTVLYGDPHAHLFALPVALLALAFSISVVFSRLHWKSWLGAAAGFIVGGLAIGALYPINLSDIYTYLPLGIAALVYAAFRSNGVWLPNGLRSLPLMQRRFISAGLLVLLLVGLAYFLYQPYRAWYGQGYSSILPWQGPRTPGMSYFAHWGLFLFIFISWLAWETREWMASTPLSALGKLVPYKALIFSSFIFLSIFSIGLVVYGVHIGWMVVPLAAWAGILLLRPVSSDSRRVVLFLMGTGLAISLMVEVVVVRGDIGRMNTVFKFYLQSWTLFAVIAAVILGWLFNALPRWNFAWRGIWQFGMVFLTASAFLYPLLASSAKIRDRMVPEAPRSLDGMAYMAHARYNNLGAEIDLNQDYHAIRWMQENISGSPVIVEATSPNQYAWFSRFSIYTGLPAVRGWEWHQIQQRVLAPTNQVIERGYEVANFYQTSDLAEAYHFLEKYQVSYIVLGQVERSYYQREGIEKFSQLEGQMWRTVYQDRDTIIYEVLK
jgi:YYY domain-containing protein